MPRIAYKDIRFRPETLDTIIRVCEIINEYARQGYDLTLRQLFYRLVATGFIANTEREYKKLGSIVNDGRLAGLIDWEAIVDRTRELEHNTHWRGPEDILDAAAETYAIDKWELQNFRLYVFVEKDALKGVFSSICSELDVPLLSCRGYTSQSEMWLMGQRLQKNVQCKQIPLILHFGDHDPSGIDMTRDITERIEMFMGGVEVKRLALNMDQVEEYDPPPNPAKVSDSRFEAYLAEFGDESWELDALEPSVLVELVRATVLQHRDEDKWQEAVDEENEAKQSLQQIGRHFQDVMRFLDPDEE